jgi:hypothetical protein
VARKRQVSDVEYTGLADTAQGFTGSSTLDSSVDPGSPLPLVLSSDRNADISNPDNQFYTSTYDLWDDPDSQSSLMLSGVSDPPFASASLSTPYPLAQTVGGPTANAFSGLSKFGSGIATLMGNHPTTIAPAPTEVHGARAGVITVPSVPSGSKTAIVVILSLALIGLLFNSD